MKDGWIVVMHHRFKFKEAYICVNKYDYEGEKKIFTLRQDAVDAIKEQIPRIKSQYLFTIIPVCYETNNTP